MRRLVPILAVLAASVALTAAAGDGFSLGLADLPLEEAGQAPDPPQAFDGIALELSDDSREALVYRTALTPSSPAELRLALWESPLGRLYYGRAEAESMLGREGLVHGGRMLGIGMSSAALGDHSSSALGILAHGGSWSELTLGEKFAAGAEASFLAAILYALVEYAD